MFDDLDRYFRPERGPQGEPSRRDFEVHDLLSVVDTFESRWDELPRLHADRDEYRILILDGRMVRTLSVIGQLAADGAVELVQLDVESWPVEDDDGSEE